MTVLASHFHSTMSKTRGRSSGWAAFDLKQQQKQSLEHKVEVDPFPPMPSSSIDTTRNLVATNFLSRGSFASVVQPSANFPVLVNNCRSGNLADDFCMKLKNQAAEESDIAITHEKLKKLHSWADDSLVDDILAAVRDDVDQASAVLGAMVSSGSNYPKKDLPGTLSVLENHVHDHNIEQGGECVKLEDQPSSEPVKLIPEHLFTVPIEPEWQEDDVYLLHRKDAMRVMRSARQHSRAADNAFLRGNHFAAQQLSLKARDEWRVAEKLNARAADEILCIRNAKNDVWKLDLHGLHASEAVRVLEEHLQKIETQMPMSRSVSSYSLTKPDIQRVHLPSVEPPSCLNTEATAGQQQALSRPRQTILQVITGTGNHSRGQAALPTVIKSFLSENRYRFDDVRPGVFAVRPKFRH